MSAVTAVTDPGVLLPLLEEMTATRDTMALEHKLLRTVAAMVPMQALSLWSLDEQHAVVRAMHLPPEPQAHIQTVFPPMDIPQEVQRVLQAVVGELAVTVQADAHGVLHAWPLRTPQGIDGVLSLRAAQALAPQCLAVVRGILGVYGNYHALLDASQRDRLTGLYNRHAMDLNMDRLWAQLLRDHPADEPRRAMAQGFCLALMDVDHFKRINDGHGHVLGDEILLLVSRLIGSCFRKSDPVYRYGGEEFLVVAGVDSQASAQLLLERVRRAVEAHVFPQIGRATVSIGYVMLDPALSPSDNIGRADQALYYAKEHGRNQVQSFDRLRAQGVFGDAHFGSAELF